MSHVEFLDLGRPYVRDTSAIFELYVLRNSKIVVIGLTFMMLFVSVSAGISLTSQIVNRDSKSIFCEL